MQTPFYLWVRGGLVAEWLVGLVSWAPSYSETPRRRGFESRPPCLFARKGFSTCRKAKGFSRVIFSDKKGFFLREIVHGRDYNGQLVDTGLLYRNLKVRGGTPGRVGGICARKV